MSSEPRQPAADGARHEFRPERVRRPREQVEYQLRTAILSGHLKEGDRLPTETELAKQFAVSRSTVREALRALASSGLISTTPGGSGGSYVRGVDHRSLASEFGEAVGNILQLGTLTYAEVAQVREMLEVPAARLAAVNRADVHVAELESIVTRERDADVTDPEVRDLNAAFHRVLAEASGNRLLLALVSALHDVTHPLAFIAASPELGREAVKEHYRVVRAVKSGDAEKAGAAMEAHLKRLREHAVLKGP